MKPAPGMAWLTIVEFEIVPENSYGEDYDGDEKAANRRRQLLGTFQEMLKDSFSPIYSGFITCKIDPTFSKYFPDDANASEK